MAHILTGLIKDAYVALDRISRHRIGFIGAVDMNAAASMAAQGQSIVLPKTRAVTPSDYTPSMSLTAGSNQTIDPETMTLDYSKVHRIPWEGEQQKAYSANGLLQSTLIDQFEQGFTALNDMVEASVAGQYKLCSRASGSAGVTPFSGSLRDAARTRQILNDNGAPSVARSLIIDSEADVNLLDLSNLMAVNQAGTDETLRMGNIPLIHNFRISDSAQVLTHTKGTGTSYQTNTGTTYPVGATSITVDTGSGTVLAGDIVTFTGDENKYVVKTGVAAAGTIVINGPGLRKTLADGVAMTIGENYTANMGFSKNAIVLAARIPYKPVDQNGNVIDAAVDTEIIQDPMTGLPYLISVFPGDGMMTIAINLVWGVKLIKSEHAALLLG